jgi:hypothetical protein
MTYRIVTERDGDWRVLFFVPAGGWPIGKLQGSVSGSVLRCVGVPSWVESWDPVLPAVLTDDLKERGLLPMLAE